VDNLGHVERMVDDWERDAVAKSQRYQRTQAEVEQISITESVAGGAVSVTVGHNGLPTGIKMTEAVHRMSPDEIAAAVMQAIQKAQSKYPERMQAIVAETVGGDATSRHIVAAAVENFRADGTSPSSAARKVDAPDVHAPDGPTAPSTAHPPDGGTSPSSAAPHNTPGTSARMSRALPGPCTTLQQPHQEPHGSAVPLTGRQPPRLGFRDQ
jgi:DNA-binding protein YbaB